ncbi:DNA repair protein RecN, partial [Gemmiger sp.]|uniref:DNA repair protein RecN n=1 Tax=Gemmiger sp. TaxID=2049027 RepID=UPI003A8C9982
AVHPPRVINKTTGRIYPMLANLKIENVAVIEKAEVNFTPGFNVLTGETGAGKSILIDSINAILGNRTSRELVRSGAQKACIWATFEAIPASVKKQLEKCGYEASDDLLLYREINAEGKGSCRINGMPATAAVVRDISAGLLSIHGQHDSQSLTNPALHLDLLDQYAQNRELFAEYYRRYRELVTVKRQLDTANASEADKQRRIEALTAEIDAIDAAALQPGEEKTLQERKTVITHAQSILEGITAAHLALAGDEDGEQAGAADLLGGAVDGLQNSARLDESLAAMSERLNELYYSARDLATDLADRLDAYGFDAGELDQIESRLDTIYRIKQKFGMEVEELLARRDTAAAELENFQSSGQRIAELKARMQTLYAAAKEAAEALTQSRLKGFAAMNKQMKAALEFLNMPGIRFALKHARGPLSSHGQDTVEFLISTNPGEEPKPLAKIASGGELSRIMLAFKSALADRDALPTVIYDEIDTGVSGLAAGRIGQLLHQTAKGHQVLCITHTPQVAAFADNQLLIQKNVRNDRTFTEIHTLDMDGRVEVLARMISGDKVSELSLASARELIEKSK